MLMTTKGNLADVRAALGRDFEIGDIVDRSASNPLMAEIYEDVSPCWHVIETHPSRERTAAAHLIARRFGVFIPEKEETVVRRGRKFDQTSLMFRGYIFVFVWDILEHIDRIKAVPGVMRLVYVENASADDTKGRRRPATLTDEQVDQIRAVENRERPLSSVMIDDIVKPKGRMTHRQKKLYQLQREMAERDNEIVSCRPWSPFQEELLTLDTDGRNQSLRKALGLAA